jgi:hypothetical protein
MPGTYMLAHGTPIVFAFVGFAAIGYLLGLSSLVVVWFSARIGRSLAGLSIAAGVLTVVSWLCGLRYDLWWPNSGVRDYCLELSLSAGPALLLGGIALSIANRKMSKARQQRVGYRCSKCGYELWGLHEARCPECGTGFSPDRMVWLGPDGLAEMRRRCGDDRS